VAGRLLWGIVLKLSRFDTVIQSLLELSQSKSYPSPAVGRLLVMTSTDEDVNTVHLSDDVSSQELTAANNS